jgi:hypothetical protein
MSAADIVAKLDDLRLRPKYVDEPGTLYSGMPPECNRQLAEAQLNDLIDILTIRVPVGLTKQIRTRSVCQDLVPF